MVHEYHYMLTAGFNRPFSECKQFKPPKKFMQLAFWNCITEEQYKSLLMLLEMKDLSLKYKYLIFNNSVKKYNSALQKERKRRNRRNQNERNN